MGSEAQNASPLGNRQGGYQPTHKSQSGDKVFVACKHNNGIILRGMRKTKEREPVMGGGTREYDIYHPDGREQTIIGPKVRPGEVAPIVVGGYAFTDNVDKDLWDNWYSANEKGDLIQDQQIYALSSKEAIRSWAAERDAIVTGFEGVDPRNPGKIIRGIYKSDVVR